MMPTPAMASLMRWSPSCLHGRFPQACPCGFLGQGTWTVRAAPVSRRHDMSSGFFDIHQPIRYESPDSTNPLAFRWYQPERVVLGKRMEDHLRFAVCYWHSFCWPGTDPFGGPTFLRPWMEPGDPMAMARLKAEVAFDLFRLLDVPFFTFHDRDIAPEGASLKESNRNVREIGELFARKMET